MSKVICGEVYSAPTACGLAGVGDFAFAKDMPYWRDKTPLIEKIEEEMSGTGFFYVGFISTPECRAAKKALKARYKVVYESPVRRNSNSGNRFSFIIFDSKKD